MLVKDIMTKKVITVNPTMNIRTLAQLLVKKNISGAPVVDKKGNLLGIVREEGVMFQDKKVHLPTFVTLFGGFLSFGTKRFEEEVKKIVASRASDIMEKDIVTISRDAKVEDVATLMIEKGSFYVAVVDKEKLIGVVTKKDIVRAIARGKY
jgi:CBS domain-containing protein